jgi:hypothetical protein
MDFKFENLIYNHSKTFHQNLYSTGLQNFPDDSRFRCSQVVEAMFMYSQTSNNEQLNVYDASDSAPANYIISTAVGYAPKEWTSWSSRHRYSGKISVFKMLNDQYLKDLRKGKALLLLDQSVEGYHNLWLWEWFHKECKHAKISPAAVIYTTGDQTAEEQYNRWYKKKKLNCPKLKIIPSISLSIYIRNTYRTHGMSVKFENILQHKTNNLSTIKLYDCTNLRFRSQRILNFLHLLSSDLIPYGKLSMGDKKKWPNMSKLHLQKYKLAEDILDKVGDITPMWIDNVDPTTTGQYHEYITRILDKLYLDTWVSLVVESTFFEHEHSVFISEKTFKPIACMQPFIIVGSKHSLKYLRKLGYKTFDGFIDESYDECNDEDRFISIMNSLKQIQAIPNKLEWLRSMQAILEHNHKLFLEIGTTQSIEHAEISKYYSDYFKK